MKGRFDPAGLMPGAALNCSIAALTAYSIASYILVFALPQALIYTYSPILVYLEY